MEASDLRIGNLVKIDSCKDQPELNGKEVVIKSITTFFQLKERKGKDYYTRVQDEEGRVHSVFICYIKPIEITEKYLLKHGYLKEYTDSFVCIYKHKKQDQEVKKRDLMIMYFKSKKKYLIRDTEMKS